MSKFQFVTLSHPTEIKEKRNQSVIRAHAIRTSVKKSIVQAVQRRENFIVVELDPKNRRPIRKKKKNATAGLPLIKSPSISLLDPFNALPGSPERLRTLVRHNAAKQSRQPVFHMEDNGKLFFQGIEKIFHGALTDPSLFHALSLVLALAANMNAPNAECLMHRGEILKILSERMKDLTKASQTSTLTAMVMLVGYEYRVDGASGDSIATHIRAIDEVLKLSRTRNIIINKVIRRALFWQDLYSCLFVGTSRLLSHDYLPEPCWTRDPAHAFAYTIPLGFFKVLDTFPPDFGIILEDLNALCTLVDSDCIFGDSRIGQCDIENGQSWIQSRLVDSLNDWRALDVEDPVFEACILAAFLCAYRLYSVIFEGCFIPEFCAARLLQILSTVCHSSRWDASPELLLWLLSTGGALAERSETRLRYLSLILGPYRKRIEELIQDWMSVKSTLKMFLWSEYTMERKFYSLWSELHLA